MVKVGNWLWALNFDLSLKCNGDDEMKTFYRWDVRGAIGHCTSVDPR